MPTAKNSMPIERNDCRLDDLGTKLKQLRAMLCVAYGEGGETFRRYSDEVQDSYMWAAHDLAAECTRMLDDVMHGE